MHVRQLALSPGTPSRLELRGVASGGDAWEVALDGRVIGGFATTAEAMRGADFTLDGGSVLRVQLEERPGTLGPIQGLRVERDGVILRDADADPVQVIGQAATMLWILGLLAILGGVVVGLVADTTPGRITGGLVAVEGACVLALAVFVRRQKRWAILVGLVIFALETLGALLTLNLCAIAFRVFGLVLLVRALRAHRNLDRVDGNAVARAFE